MGNFDLETSAGRARLGRTLLLVGSSTLAALAALAALTSLLLNKARVSINPSIQPGPGCQDGVVDVGLGGKKTTTTGIMQWHSLHRGYTHYLA